MKRQGTAGLLGLAAAICAWAALSAPAALAAPTPANDDFANAEPLSDSLPIAAAGSNVGATKEEPESVGTFAAGHSVWFKWVAPSSEWITIGACGSDFADVIGVFTGASLGSLTKVGSGNASEGPHCPYEDREFTFKAVGGTTYEIAVDGNAFYMPPATPPLAQGNFELRIEATPTPANDDFADATPIVTNVEEEAEGEVFYFGSRFGYNWNATEEAGETMHVGGPNGASVWYSWTPPVSGEATVRPTFGSDLRMGMYTGDGLNSLNLLFGGIGPSGSASFTVSAETTYRIAIYGLLNGGSEAEMGNFSFNISMRAPAPTHSSASDGGGPAPIAPDTSAPQTTIGKRTLRPGKRSATFAFQSSEGGGAFVCQLDDQKAAPCSSPKTFEHLRPGRHTLAVAAIDASGNKDPTPALTRFKLSKPQPRHSGTA